jgi:predicted nucleic acid-binding protein
MELVIDTNIAFGFFSPDPFLRSFVSRHSLELFSVNEFFDELLKIASKIQERTGISSGNFESILAWIHCTVCVLPVSQQETSSAAKLIRHAEDAPFLALAMKLGIPVWSNDSHFKEQSLVQVYTVSELKELLASKRDS